MSAAPGHMVKPDRPPRRSRRRTVAMLLAALVAALAGPPAHADHGDDLQTAAIKTAFIYNFAKFTTWPSERFATPSAPLLFCVRDDDLDHQAVMTLDGKMVGDRTVRTRSLEDGASIAGCHVYFTSDVSSPSTLRSLLASAQQNGVLLVSDMPGFAEFGGHIGLVRSENRFRFQINLGAVQECGLKLSSRLLQLAEIVETRQQ